MINKNQLIRNTKEIQKEYRKMILFIMLFFLNLFQNDFLCTLINRTDVKIFN